MAAPLAQLLLLLGGGSGGGWLSASQMQHGSALPPWAPTWQMNRSTFLMSCNNSGPFSPEFSALWGIVDLDWSNWVGGATQNYNGHAYAGWTETVPMTTQQNLRANAEMIKAADRGLGTKVFVYRNMVKALPWYGSVRKIIVDPAYSDFFLHFDCNRSATDGLAGMGGCHVPRQGSLLYHDQEQTRQGKSCPKQNVSGHNQPCCGVPCGEYVFDHR
jgi:hypothetical protein